MRAEISPSAPAAICGQHLEDADLRADLLEEAGELQTDVAAADDGDAFWAHAADSKTVSESSVCSDWIPGIGGTAGREPVASRMLAAS